MEELGLAEAIEAVRAELRKAQVSGRGSDLRFAVGSVEVEFLVEVSKTAGGEASVKVFNLVSIGGKGEATSGQTNRVKVVLNPTGADGGRLEVASAQGHRPDATAHDDGDVADQWPQSRGPAPDSPTRPGG